MFLMAYLHYVTKGFAVIFTISTIPYNYIIICYAKYICHMSEYFAKFSLENITCQHYSKCYSCESQPAKLTYKGC